MLDLQLFTLKLRQVFATFEERYGADLDGRSTLLVMGDAHNNYRDPAWRRFAGWPGGFATSTDSTPSRRRMSRTPRTWSSAPMPSTAISCSRYANLRQLVACVDETTAG